MIPDFGQTTYTILSKVVNLKFKAQINNSGIELRNIYRMINLETQIDSYVLVTNVKSIVFKNQMEFIKEFIQLLEKNITELKMQFKDLQERSREHIVDENAIYMEHEYIGHCQYKQSKLLIKMYQLAEQNVG